MVGIIKRNWKTRWVLFFRFCASGGKGVRKGGPRGEGERRGERGRMGRSGGGGEGEFGGGEEEGRVGTGGVLKGGVGVREG